MTEEHSTKRRRFFSANSIERALVEAASYHGVAPERIAYKSIEKKHGFVKNARRAVIEVDPDHPLLPAGVPQQRAQAAAAMEKVPARAATARPEPRPRPSEGREPSERRETARGEAYAVPAEEWRGQAEEEAASTEERARRALDRLLRLGGLEVSADLTLDGDRLDVNLHGADEAALLEDDAELLQSIEYLLPRLLGDESDGLTCRTDCGGFRKRREEELQALARRTADIVRASGHEIALDPLNPAERRVVHLALAEDPDVETESAGEGFFKRLTIRRRP